MLEPRLAVVGADSAAVSSEVVLQCPAVQWGVYGSGVESALHSFI